MVEATAQRFLQLDVLRGVAALTVVFSHYFPYWTNTASPIPILVPGIAGYYAVKLFFVISGFVIFITLERCRTVADFAVLRLSRLYPAYWTSLIVVTVIGLAVGDEKLWIGGLIVNLTMFQQFLGFAHFDNVYWSLSVELVFYANVAVLFALGLHRHTRAIVLVWLLLASIWIVVFHSPGAVTAGGVLANEQRDWFALLFAFDYAPYFGVGILFYRARTRGWDAPSQFLMLFAALVEFLLASWEGLAVIAVIAAVFALAVRGQLGRLTGRVTLWLGAISYSLYLVHRNLGHHVLDWLAREDVNAFVAIALAAVCALLVASAFTYGVERPVLSWIRSRYAWSRDDGRRALSQGSARATRASLE